MTTRFGVLLILTALVLSASAAVEAEVKTLGWMCHDYNMDYLRETIKMAPSFGVNHLQMDNLLQKHGDNLPENQQQIKDIAQICKLCNESGIGFYLWVREINGFPDELRVDGKIDLDKEQTWEWMTRKYNELFDTCPGLSGVILTLRESNVPVQHSGHVASKMSGAERVAKLVSTINDVCKARGKKMYVRDFSIAPGEMQNIIDAVNLMPRDVRAMSKAVARDWHPYLPDNPAFGQYPGREHIAEFDLGSEYNGQGAIPYIIAEELHRRWQNARSKGALGTVGRIDRFDAHIFDSLDEANAHIYSDIVLRDLDAKTATRNYCVKRFGEESADVLTECLLRTYTISNDIYFTLRNKFINCHSTVPDLSYADSHIASQSLAIWIPEEKKTEDELHKPTMATMDKVIAEKDEAIRLADQNLADLKSVKSKMKPEDYEWVRPQFQRAADVARFWKAMAVAYMMSRVYMTDPSEECLRLADLRLAEFDKAIDALEKKHGPDFKIGNDSRQRNKIVPRARSLSKKIRQRLDKVQSGGKG